MPPPFTAPSVLPDNAADQQQLECEGGIIVTDLDKINFDGALVPHLQFLQRPL